MLLLLRGDLRMLRGEQVSESAERHPASDGSLQQRPPRNDMLKPMMFVNPLVVHKLSHGAVRVLSTVRVARA